MMDLILWRHAEAHDAQEGEDDLLRTLTTRGEKQAARMAVWLDRQLPQGLRVLVALHPRFHMHFTPTSASWLNMVERFFRDLTTERLRRGVFTSVPDLVKAIDDYVAHHNIAPKPFIWTKSARDILQKVIRANSRLSSKQNRTLH